ncbi:MAG: redox-sensing transcriptional repressor Rex [Planctomycetota bacterium]
MTGDQPSPSNSIGHRSPGKDGSAPKPAVRRLSLYLRELETLYKRGRETISSKQLGEALGYTDSQVRKDLAYFGQFGHPGIGYHIDGLIARLRCILGTDRTWNVLLVGAGNLGNALLSYRGFNKKGFQIVAVFDNDPEKVGQKFGVMPELEVLPLDELEKIASVKDIQMGIIAVPPDDAQSIVDRLIAVGIKGILNFAPASLSVPSNIPVDSVDLTVHLEQLAFHVISNQVASEQ